MNEEAGNGKLGHAVGDVIAEVSPRISACFRGDAGPANSAGNIDYPHGARGDSRAARNHGFAIRLSSRIIRNSGDILIKSLEFRGDSATPARFSDGNDRIGVKTFHRLVQHQPGAREHHRQHGRRDLHLARKIHISKMRDGAQGCVPARIFGIGTKRLKISH